MNLELKDKVVIITGSSRGIGRATAIQFAKEGAKMVVNYRTQEEKAIEVVEEIKKLGSEAIAIKADITQEADIDDLIQTTMQRFGRIDVLVNNAAIYQQTDALNLSREDIDKVMNLNVFGTRYAIQQVAKIMLEQKSGAIVNVTSVSGTTVFGSRVEYEMSKSSVNAMTFNYAKKLGPHIRVNAVAPGNTLTDMSSIHSAEKTRSFADKAVLKKNGKPEEIASAIVFLASSAASHITGQILVVDGGLTLK